MTGSRQRAEHLLAVHAELLTVADTITEAATVEGEPLRQLRLVTLLEAIPGWTTSKAETLIVRLCRKAGADVEPWLNVGWLIDPDAVPDRLEIFADLFASRYREPPAPRWPYEPARPATTVR